MKLKDGKTWHISPLIEHYAYYLTG